MSFLDSRTNAARQGIGQPVRRAEDRRLITGRGRYSDDVTLPRQVHAAFLRSPHAHARIRSIDVRAAAALAGVLAVFTGTDAAELAGIPHRPVPTNPHEVPMQSRDGSAFFAAPRPPLPADRVRCVGEPVVMVVTETAALARDGVDHVVVDYEPLAAVVGSLDAVAPGMPVVWDEAKSNLCVDSLAGDEAAVQAAIAHAAHVVRFQTRVNRVTGSPSKPVSRSLT